MPDKELLERVLEDLILSCQNAIVELRVIYLVDNGPGPDSKVLLESLKSELFSKMNKQKVEIISGQGNVGYGKGHNLAIELSDSEFHLILNPDIFTDAKAIDCGIRYLKSRPDVGMVVPVARDQSGTTQYLAKRYPDLLTLLIRAFFAKSECRWIRCRIARYEMRAASCGQEPMAVPLASGCFMLARTSLLQSQRGFDESFFMYFEDYDLSRRFNRIARIIQLPDMKVVHLGGGAAQKGVRHILYFIRSAIRFFNRYGWKFC